MYVNPFWAGVFATVFVEILAAVIWAIWYASRH